MSLSAGSERERERVMVGESGELTESEKVYIAKV